MCKKTQIVQMATARIKMRFVRRHIRRTMGPAFRKCPARSAYAMIVMSGGVGLETETFTPRGAASRQQRSLASAVGGIGGIGKIGVPSTTAARTGAGNLSTGWSTKKQAATPSKKVPPLHIKMTTNDSQ